MPILKSINDLKPVVYEIEQEAKTSMPEEIRDNVIKSIREITDAINRTSGLIEKHYRDEELLVNMKKSLSEEMAKERIYKGVSEKQKDQIMEAVIEDPEINLLDEDEFKEFVLDQLKTSTPENLIKTAYSKQSIIELGDAVASRGASQSDKYQSGLDILFDMVKTPTGREDALAQGAERAISDSLIRNHYLFLYYGLLPGGEEEAGGEDTEAGEAADTAEEAASGTGETETGEK